MSLPRTPAGRKKRSMTPVSRSADLFEGIAGVQRDAGVICFTDGTSMEYLKIRNWDRWQSYRSDRGLPPWIKVHRQILRNAEWVSLTDAQRGQLLTMWILAADKDGEIPSDPRVLKILCHMESEPDMDLFVTLGFIEPTPLRRHIDVSATPTCGIGVGSDEGQMKDRGSTDEGIVAAKPATAISIESTTRDFIDAFIARWRKEHPDDFSEKAARLYLNRTIDGIAACYANRKGSFTAARIKAWATRLARYDTDAVMTACEVYCDRYSEQMDERYMAGIALKMNQLGPKERDLELARHRKRMGDLGILKEVKNA